MKTKAIMTLLSIFALLQLTGCSFSRYPIGDISKIPKTICLDINNIQALINFPFYELELESQNEKLKVTFNQSDRNNKIDNFIKTIKSNVKPDTKVIFTAKYTITSLIREIDTGGNKTFSVKYQNCLASSHSQVLIPVEFTNGRKYPAYLDTGFNSNIFLTSDIVVDNKLVAIPKFGACHIPVFNIGPAQVKDTVAFIDEQQWQFRILNIPFYKHSVLILGREFIRSFVYVMFDNVHKEAVFSKEDEFTPDNPQSWSSYPFIEDPNGGNTIVVKIPLAGKVLDIAFDSCWGEPGLFINKNHWETIKQDLSFRLLGKVNETTYQGIKLPARKATISSLSIGEKTLKNAEVHISDNSGGYSVMGLAYFQDTIVVLDYVNKLFWIKKHNIELPIVKL